MEIQKNTEGLWPVFVTLSGAILVIATLWNMYIGEWSAGALIITALGTYLFYGGVTHLNSCVLNKEKLQIKNMLFQTGFSIQFDQISKIHLDYKPAPKPLFSDIEIIALFYRLAGSYRRIPYPNTFILSIYYRDNDKENVYKIYFHDGKLFNEYVKRFESKIGENKITGKENIN